MDFIRLNGTQFEEMMVNALNNLRLNEEHVNSINVFPVPDGDTGSNMRLTLENGIKYAKSNIHAGEYLCDLARGMLYGARGNSGVILSQLFSGFAEELKRDSIVDSVELYEGFEAGYKKAYEAVSNPKEGTLLTVSREGIENIDEDSLSRGENVSIFFGLYLANLKRSLDKTPELLPSLKEAGVVDSGGLGYVKIIEGIVKYLNDEVLESDEEMAEESKVSVVYPYNITATLNTDAIGKKEFDKKELVNDLCDICGDISILEDGLRYSFVIPTFKPDIVFRKLIEYGKVEEFDIKENKDAVKSIPVCKIGIVNGIEIREIYMGLGCNIVIDGGKTMNTSTEEIMNAIKSINADKYIVFPNNKNIFPAVYQAAKILNLDNVDVIESKNILEGYYALSCDDETKEYDYRIKEMKSGLDYIHSIEIFKASKNAKYADVLVKKGFYTSSDGNILASCEEFKDCVLESLKKIDLSDYSQIIVLKGQNYEEDDDSLSELLSDYFGLDVTFIEGGQQIHDAIIGLI